MVLLISWLFLPSINEKRNIQRMSSVTVNSQESTSSRSVISSVNTYSESSSSKIKAVLKLHDSTLKPPSEEQCKAAKKEHYPDSVQRKSKRFRMTFVECI